MLLLSAVASVSAASPEQALVLSVAERTAITRAFAPVFVFHALEESISDKPCIPARLITLVGTVRRTSGGFTHPLGQLRTDGARYRALSVEEKLEQSAVQYRVFSRLVGGRIEVVAEYWCYYRLNAFTVRVVWFPYRVPDNHPHDMERVYFVLRPGNSPARPPFIGMKRGAKRISRRSCRHQRPRWQHSPNQYVAHAGETLVPPLAYSSSVGLMRWRQTSIVTDDSHRQSTAPARPSCCGASGTAARHGADTVRRTWICEERPRCGSVGRPHPCSNGEACQPTRCRRPASCRTGSARSRSPPPIDATSLVIRRG